MIALSIILIAVFGLLCTLAIRNTKQITDTDQRRKLIAQEIERRYWFYRHGERWWPGKED